MAENTLLLDKKPFICSICLELLKEPVSIQCGHSYCMNCLNTHWNEEASKKSYSCPQCRQKFPHRPVLVKNTMLAVLMEGLKKTGLPAAPADHIYAAHGDVSCDLCSGRKLKAVKSCLQCLVSYCKDHLQPHYDVAALKRHKLVEPTDNLQDNICSEHQEAMKMFCRTDQQCICYLCSVDQHKGHDLVTAAEERTEKERDLEAFQQKIIQTIKTKQKHVLRLDQEVRNIRDSADTAVQHCGISLKGLIDLIDSNISYTRDIFMSGQIVEKRQAKNRQDQLQQQISELKRQYTELETLSHTEDHCQFLQNLLSLSELADVKPIELDTYGLEDYHPVFWDLFMESLCDITLDPNTLHNTLSISAENRKVSHTQKDQTYYTHPERFTDQPQVLSREALPDICYIEVNVNYSTSLDQGFRIGVTYRDIPRNGTKCCLGSNEKSWALVCSVGVDSFFINKTIGSRLVSTGPKISRVGIYLDQTSGVLQFLKLDEPKILMANVRTKFTQPLYLGLGLFGEMDSLEICKLT